MPKRKRVAAKLEPVEQTTQTEQVPITEPPPIEPPPPSPPVPDAIATLPLQCCDLECGKRLVIYRGRVHKPTNCSNSRCPYEGREGFEVPTISLYR